MNGYLFSGGAILTLILGAAYARHRSRKKTTSSRTNSPRAAPGYESIPPKGRIVGSGSEGTVYELSTDPDWVLKEFKTGTLTTQASNEAEHLAELRKVFGDRHVVKTIEPPRRFPLGEPVVLLKEKVTPARNPDLAARRQIENTLREKGIQADVGENLMWGTTAGDPVPRWIWIE